MDWSKKMKKILKFRTKIEAIVAVSILIAVSIGSVFAVRTITDSSDTIYTTITNSKGNSWTATGANFYLAYYDLNSTNGGWVEAPGNLTLTKPVNLVNYTEIRGYGVNNTIFYRANGWDDTMFVAGWNGHDAAGPGGPTSGRHHIKMTGITFDGNNVSNTWTQYSFIIGLSANTNNITFRDCLFRRSLSDCIWTWRFAGQTTGLENIIVDACTFIDTEKYVGDYPAGVFVGGRFFKITNSHFIDCWGSGVAFESNSASNYYCRDNIVQGCTMTGETATGVWMENGDGSNNTVMGNLIHNLNSSCYAHAGIAAANRAYAKPILCGQDGSIIIGNRIENVTDYGIVMGGARSICSDNIIMNVIGGHVDNSYRGMGIYILAPISYSDIHHNTIIGHTAYGIVTSTSATVTNNAIDHNIIVGGTRGISLNGVNNNTIKDNQIAGSSSYGISSNNGRSLMISNNKITGCTPGLKFTGTNKWLTVIGNDVANNTGTITYTTSPTDSTIALNLGSPSMTLPIYPPAYYVAGSMAVNITTGDIAVYSGAAWIWTHG
ncbi:MAG TPA: right-handed parallel beta-helix repeat-containing protein [Candidatus Thermoplasmatota archaeon]|nr:right-handed parallel beta-helix repeat-containing protein [Candidatus Thermoplasmatota archaeon]